VKPRALLLGGMLAAVAVPAPAGAAVKTVYMGEPPSYSKQFEQGNSGDANAFFPSAITVNAGAPVKFVPAGFHTLDIPAKGGSQTPLFTPGDPLSGVNDAAGNPFWFNGQPSLGFNPALFNFTFGKTLTYTGKTAVESGLPVMDNPKPVTVKFAKPGTYTYYCDVHPGMKATVHVVAKKAKAPSVKSDAALVKKQVARALKELKALSRTKVGSGTIQIGASAPHGVESYQFFPAKTSVKVGTTVTFKMPVNSTEDHTASTGPGDPEQEPASYLGQIAAGLQGPGNPALFAEAAYASEQPGGTPASLTPTLHGNGFWNSGVLDASGATPLPASNSVTFAQAGTYTFYCLIHPFMKATVTVTS
jgi:plastocyanin